MNPDIQSLQMHPHVFSSFKFLTEQELKPIKRTFLIGMPRSGTTLWARLMENACYSRCVGDKHDDFYHGILRIYNEIKTNKGFYMDYVEAEKKDIFPDEIRAYHSRESELKNFRYVAANLLFANTFGGSAAKSTILGFTNNLLVPFVEMLRDLFKEDDLTICFMIRNIDDAVASFIQKNPNLSDCEEITRREYEHQLSEMKKATDLGDVWIKYEDFIKDPIPFLRRSNPTYMPNPELVKGVMNKVLR